MLGRPTSAVGSGASGRRVGEGGQPMGLPHSRHEGRVVGAMWSSDPEDCHFCKSEVCDGACSRGLVVNGVILWLRNSSSVEALESA